MPRTAPPAEVPVRAVPQQRSASRVRYPGLDGMRGFATLVVITHHVWLTHPRGWIPGHVDETLRLFTAATWTSLDSFFVLSGFLITGLLLDAREERGYLLTFYARRVLRIFPVYFLFLAFWLHVVPHFTDRPEIEMLRTNQVWAWSYLTNMLIAKTQSFQSVGYLPISNFWSLAIEEQFYLLWPLLLYPLRRRSIAVLCVTLVGLSLATRLVAYASGYNWIFIYVFTFGRLDGIALGSLLAVAYRAPGGLARWLKPAVWVGGFALVGLGWIYSQTHLDPEAPLTFRYGFTLSAVFFAALVIVAIERPRVRGLGVLFCSPFLARIARHSYAMYIVHGALLFLAPTYVFGWHTMVGMSWLNGYPFARFVITSALACTACFLIAVAIWHLVEEPFLRLKRFVPTGAERRAPLLATANVAGKGRA